MAINVLPIRRDIKFSLPKDRALDWHRTGVHVSQFLNTMSLFFPVGERFFIDSVRAFRDQVDDPELKKAITAFIGQEAMHGREHDELNDILHELDIPVKAQERTVTRLLNLIQKTTPKAFQLSATVALEHLTAIMGDAVLRNDEVFFTGADPKFTALWRWHALEETEHKAVAFDLYSQVMGKTLAAYSLRVITLPIATGIFFALLYYYYARNVAKAGGLTNIRGWITSLQFQWGRPGVLRQAIKPWLDWFKPGFHPWDHDNRHFLESLDDLLGAVLEKEAA
ncbi:MAG: metal-dependent hydrolase [Alcanivoracaceae bacterium]